MKTYLVTGGSGFIGSNFILYLLHNDPECKIVNLDALTYAGNPENLREIEQDDRYCFIQGNITDQSLVEHIFQENTIDYVVNFAAESHVDRSILNPEIFVRTNVLGTLNLLNAAKHAWATGEDSYKAGCKFLQVSTDEVYGSLGKEGFFTEKTQIDPHSPYSASKAAADLLVKSYHDTYRFPINITRCSNNYGPFQFPEKLMPLLISNALAGKRLPIYGDGLNVRDWLYVGDHCMAIATVLRQGRVGEVYNIGGNNEKTNLQIVTQIIGSLHDHQGIQIDESAIEFVEDRKGHDRRYAIDATKIEKELGWQPSITFEQGIKQTIEWYCEHTQWLENIENGLLRNGDNKVGN